MVQRQTTFPSGARERDLRIQKRSMGGGSKEGKEKKPIYFSCSCTSNSPTLTYLIVTTLKRYLWSPFYKEKTSQRHKEIPKVTQLVGSR